MLTLLPDIPITRRKRVHMIVDENGDLLLAAKTIEEAITWLIDNGHAKIVLQTGVRHYYQLDLQRPIDALAGIPKRPAPHPI